MDLAIKDIRRHLGKFVATIVGVSMLLESLTEAQYLAMGTSRTALLTAETWAADLAALDRYEEYDPASPATSWYLRETRTLTTGVPVSVYRMNGTPPAGALPIPGGDFRAWLKAQNLREFSGRNDA